MQERQFNQPWFTLLTQAFIAGATFVFFGNIQQRAMVDTSAIFIYQFYGFFAIGLLLILTVWSFIERKKISQNVLNGLFLVVNIFLFFFGLDKIQDLPYQQRFVLKNDTSYPLTEIQILGDTTIELGTLQPNQKAKATYNNYIENSSIDMTCYFGQKRDTVTLVAGLTNSIGYLNVVSITIENQKLKVDKSQ
jgi:hypothetical protein